MRALTILTLNCRRLASFKTPTLFRSLAYRWHDAHLATIDFPILQDDSFVLHVSTLGFWRRRQNNDGVVTDRLLCRWASTATTKRCHPDPQSRNQPLLHLCAVCSSMHKHYAKSHTEMHMAPACTLVLVASAGENGIWC